MENLDTAIVPSMLQTIERYINFNRTIASDDSLTMLRELQKVFPLELESYRTGSEHQTWIIPPSWNVRRAELSDASGIIASYAESPLFLAPYSHSFTGWVTKEQLKDHVISNPNVPDAFSYEFRLAYDFKRRLQDWRISLPHDRLQRLGVGPFHIDIEVDTSPGAMHVGVGSHAGSSGYWFTFLAHYCHVGQANDGLAGVVIMLETFRRIRERFHSPVHGYRVLLVPETIGSSVYAATHEDELDSTLGAVFSEMGGAESPMQLVTSRRGNTYLDRIFRHVLENSGYALGRTVPFRSGWGNDELIFDSPGLGVPALSLDRYPFDPYHTSSDDINTVDEARLNEIVSVLEDVVEILEVDFIPQPISRVPIYMTRFGLYADWTSRRTEYDLRATVMDNLWARLSVFDIAVKHNLDFRAVLAYLHELRTQGLIEGLPVDPSYAREVRIAERVETSVP